MIWAELIFELVFRPEVRLSVIGSLTYLIAPYPGVAFMLWMWDRKDKAT